MHFFSVFIIFLLQCHHFSKYGMLGIVTDIQLHSSELKKKKKKGMSVIISFLFCFWSDY